jgi:ABC-type Fe3+/spermidine/putrescine transport system ATPase subunit
MIRIDELVCKLGDFTLTVDLTVSSGEYFVILGPNGAGKTVLLETLAGFNSIDHGRIILDDKEIDRFPSEKRGIGIVYQDDCLFNHLTVRENVIFGPKVRKEKLPEIEKTLDWVTGITGIYDLLSRKPDTLSGGERRKVALARALSIKPGVLLLDEPLGALDPETKEKMILELKNIHSLLKLTVIHVCHGFSEAVSLGDRIGVMEGGRIRQTGTPQQIFRQPNSEFVARFTMARNIFEGEVKSDDKEGTIFRTAGIGFAVAGGAREATHAVIRPEDISISTEPADKKGGNCLQGKSPE